MVILDGVRQKEQQLYNMMVRFGQMQYGMAQHLLIQIRLSLMFILVLMLIASDQHL